MGPPETKIVGILRRMAAISIPGVILSQLLMQIMASTVWALHIYSTLSAISSRDGSEYSIPACPMAIPSSMAMVLNSAAKQPSSAICFFIFCPISWRCTCPGTNWVKELTMAITGFPNCSSVMPLARQRLLAPAIFLPFVVVSLRNGIVIIYCPVTVFIFLT